MQPRLRTLVWREMPPCVRRLYIAWARRFHYAELFLGRLYLSLTRSPTWNFVAVAGTLGIFLTILLFLVPWEPTPNVQAGVQKAKAEPKGELESKLLAIQTPREEGYPVELELAADTHLADDPPRRRRRAAVPDPEPVEDWFIEEPQTSRPPRLGWDVEVVAAIRRPRRAKFSDEQYIDEVSWTASTESFNETEIDSDWNFARDDLWQPFDDTRLDSTRRSNWDDFNDHRTVAASSAGEPIGEPLPEAMLPESAESLVDVELELSWNRPASRRRRAVSPQLYLRNLGPQPIPQVDVIAGAVPDDESFSELRGQSVLDLASEAEQSVIWPGGSSRREIVSVLVTAYVGGSTDVAAPPSPRPQSRPDLRIPNPPQPSREPARPHLTLTIGTPGRLAAEKMISVPMEVVNDGNVPLDDVVIVADIPDELQHRFGRKVQYVLGRMQPGEVRPKTLLVTPLEAGTSRVPLQAVDGRQSAEDSGEVRITVAADEVEADHAAAEGPRAEDAETKPDPPRRRRSREREPRTK